MAIIQAQPEGVQENVHIPCKKCGGRKYKQWWESPRRRALQCADPDCGVFLILAKGEQQEDAET